MQSIGKCLKSQVFTTQCLAFLKRYQLLESKFQLIECQIFFSTPCFEWVGGGGEPRGLITLQFLSIKDFRPLGIEIELLIDHITVVTCIK